MENLIFFQKIGNKKIVFVRQRQDFIFMPHVGLNFICFCQAYVGKQSASTNNGAESRVASAVKETGDWALVTSVSISTHL